MFDISFWELTIIFVITLLVVGPDRLPELVRDLGRWVRKLRRVVVETQYEFEREFNFEEERRRLEKEGKNLNGAIDELDELMSIAPDREEKNLDRASDDLDEVKSITPDKEEKNLNGALEELDELKPIAPDKDPDYKPPDPVTPGKNT